MRNIVCLWSLPVLVALAVALAAGTVAVARPGGGARAHTAQACAGDRVPHDPRNPLDLASAPGRNPLNGARFFVDGPRHGSAAGAIASLAGFHVQNLPDALSASSLLGRLGIGPLHVGPLGALVGGSGVAREVLRVSRPVQELEKIATEPEAQRFSAFSSGGGPGAIRGQVNKIFCGNLSADPRSVPIISTYFAHPGVNGCSRGNIAAAMPVFRRRIDEMASTTGNHPAVYLLELDALGSSACYARAGAMSAWEAMLRYEVDKMAALPHTVVYLEAGYSDSNGAAYTARALNKIGIGRIRGFFTNDTHINWTINEVRWAEKISRMTRGAHYIVNTAQNGNGPLINRNRVRYGNEDLCNPPRRGLGPLPTTNTGFPHADAFLWTHVPGNSSGSCNGGPPSGSFWTAKAIDLASLANDRIGPHYPSRPY